MSGNGSSNNDNNNNNDKMGNESSAIAGDAKDEIMRMPVPPIPVKFANLDNLSVTALQHLLNDPHALELHVEERSEIKELEDMRNMLSLQVCMHTYIHTYIHTHTYVHKYMYLSSLSLTHDLTRMYIECSTSRTKFETDRSVRLSEGCVAAGSI